MSQALIVTSSASAYVKVPSGLGTLSAMRIEMRVRKYVPSSSDDVLLRYEPMGQLRFATNGTVLLFSSYKSGETASDFLSFRHPEASDALIRRDEFLLRFQFDPNVPRYSIELWDLFGNDYLSKEVTSGVTATALTISDHFAVLNSGYASAPMQAELDFCRIYTTNVPLGSAPPSLVATGGEHNKWEFEGVLTDGGSVPSAMVWQGAGGPTYANTPEAPSAAPVLSSAVYGTNPDRVTLTYTDPNSGGAQEAHVDIERRLGTTGDWVRVGFNIGTGTTSYVDTTIAHGAAYDYRVKARNRMGSSPYSNTVAVTTGVGVDTNPTITENAKPGTPLWKLTNPATLREVEGYADATSVNRGSTINLKVNSAGGQNFDLHVFRMGWYGGNGARLVKTVTNLPGTVQTMPTEGNPATNRYTFECNWTTSYALATADPDPTEWPSGIYLARLTRVTDGKQAYIVFCLRDDARKSALYYNQPVNTYHAYNSWPRVASQPRDTGSGRGMYGFAASGLTAEVSFNRPYMIPPRADGAFGIGAGELLAVTAPTGTFSDRGLRTPSSEISWIRFMEKQGYDVQYGTDVDLHSAGESIWARCAGLVFPGHQEYWSRAMRDTVVAARDYGRNLLFGGANAAYWPVRFINGPVTGQANRSMVSYKGLDGDTPPDPLSYTNRLWRQLGIIPRPEEAFIGVQYIGDPAGDAPITFAAGITTHPLGAGTGLSNGTSVAGLVGYEWDNIQGGGPPGLITLAHSEFPPNSGGVTSGGIHEMTVYDHASGAQVLGTGTMQLIWAADDYGATAPESARPSYLHAGVTTFIANALSRQSQYSVAGAGAGAPGADHLAVTTQPTSPIASGGVHATQPVVTVRSVSNGTVTTDTSTVTAFLDVQTGTASALGALTKAAVAGVADFAGNGLGATSAAGATARWGFQRAGLPTVYSDLFVIAASATVESQGAIIFRPDLSGTKAGLRRETDSRVMPVPAIRLGPGAPTNPSLYYDGDLWLETTGTGQHVLHVCWNGAWISTRD